MTGLTDGAAAAEGQHSADHPYAPAILAGDVVYVSGALSIDRYGEPVAGREEALDAALDGVADRLATVGAGLDDLVKLTYYVTDITLREEANAQFLRIFAAAVRPARTFLEVRRLPYGATVEIDAIAHVRPTTPGP